MFDRNDNLLKCVSSPGQYINSEFNCETYSIKPKWSKQEVVKICLSYPDKYIVGMSNLGIEILYKMLNSYDNILCERIFAPDVDMENLLKFTGSAVFSLETQHKLTDFDIIGFSLQHELCYTNIFTILSLAKIPFKRYEREKIFPLVIAGGPCSCNPEVLSDYIDLFILGEAEESLLQVANIVAEYKKNLLKNNNHFIEKKQLLNMLDKIQSVYIPESKKTVFPSVVDLKKSFYPETPTVPIIRTTHLRLNIELTRGCGYSCNFCQAGYTHKPLRYRDKKYVCYLIEKGIMTTGYDEVAFTGFCVTNYPYLLEIIDFTNQKFGNMMVSISLPSLRIEDINEDLLKKLSLSPRKTTITLAPEAATERLRKIINKEINDNDIFQKISLLYKYGFKKIKLYFMIGLPTETEEDIEAIPKFIKQLYKTLPGIRINLAISIFVPKPHTPFQYLPMEKYEVLYRKLIFLAKQLKRELHIKSINKKIYSSFIEALISRGDKQIGNLIESVWYEGARFDNWKESFNPEIWLKKIHQYKIELDKYIFTKYESNNKFVWDSIVYQVSKEKLYEICFKHINQNQFMNYTSNNFSKRTITDVKTDQRIITSVDKTVMIRNESNNFYTLRLRFSRRGKVKFISYLDQIEIIKRAFRLSSLPVNYTCGFNPQIKMSLGPAIPVGYESNSEYVDVELYKEIEVDKITKDINKYLPEGFSLIKTKLFFSPLNKLPALNNTVNLAEYIIIYHDYFDYEKLQQFLSMRSCIIEKQRKNAIETINLFDIIKDIQLKDLKTLYLLCKLLPNKTVRPEIIVAKIFSIEEKFIYKFDILRENLYIENSKGNLLNLI